MPTKRTKYYRTKDVAEIYGCTQNDVRPCECYGGKGEPIYSDWQKPLNAK